MRVIVIPTALQKALGDDASRDLAAVLKETIEAAASSVSVAGAVDFKAELKGEIARVRTDLRRVEDELRTEIARVEQSLKTEFRMLLDTRLSRMEGSLLYWIVGLGFSQAVLTLVFYVLLRGLLR